MNLNTKQIQHLVLYVAAVFLFVIPVQSRAQGTIVGKVTAAGGQGLPGVMVMATHVDRRIEESTVTDSSGNYRLIVQYPGVLNVVASEIGYKVEKREGVRLAVEATTINFDLQANSDDRSTIEQLPYSSFLSLLPDGWAKREFILTEMTGLMRRAVLDHPPLDELTRRIEAAVRARNRPMLFYTTPAIFPTEDYERPEAIARWVAKYASRGDALKKFRRPVPSTADTSNVQITQYFVPQGHSNHDLYVSSDGIVWATQKPNGLWRLDPKTGEGRIVPFELANRGIVPSGDGHHVWIVTYQGKIVEFDLKTETIGRVFDLGKQFDGFFPHTLKIDHDGNLWVGDYVARYPGRAAEINPASGKMTLIDFPALSLPFDRSATENYGLTVCPDDQVWTTLLHASTIVRIDPHTLHAEPIEFGVTDGGPRRLDCAPDGNVWIPAHSAGEVLRYDPITDSYQRFSLPTPDAGPYTLKVDPKTGNIWISTRFSGQVYRYNVHTREFSVFQMPTDQVFWGKDFQFVGEHEVWVTQDGWGEVSLTRIRY